MKRFIISILSVINPITCYKIIKHPLEKRIGYVKNLKHLDKNTLNNLHQDFQTYPMLIFKDLKDLNPQEFLEFACNFDEYADMEIVKNPNEHITKSLQPFDQLPSVPNVAPRGYMNITNLFGLKHLEVAPFTPFVDNYIYHVDMLGHEFKRPNVVTGFKIIKQPPAGGETVFISGETVFENLSFDEQLALKNILVINNRRKFITGTISQNLAGTTRTENFVPIDLGNVEIPLIYDTGKIPCVLMMPSFMEKISGLPVKESREFMRNFMETKVLPYKITIDWKEGDIAIFNNRRFIHSSTPAQTYINNEDNSERLLLQCFIPTTKPLKSFIPHEKDVFAAYNAGYIKDIETSIITAHKSIEFASMHNYTDGSKYVIV